MRANPPAHDAAAIAEIDGNRLALLAFMDCMNRYGEWDDGCFYYNGRAASELQEPIRLARASLAQSKGEE